MFLFLMFCHRTSTFSENASAYPPLGRFPVPSFPDRKSTRLNSSHSQISYAVFCLKKKTRRIAAVRERGRRQRNDRAGEVADVDQCRRRESNPHGHFGPSAFQFLMSASFIPQAPFS